MYVFTTPSSVTSQGGEQPEGPSLGTPVARALCGHHRARRADEVRAASNTTCSVDCRTLGPSQGESLYQGPPADGEEVTRQDYKATKAETHHPSPCTKAKQDLHSTVRRFLTQTPRLLRSVSLQGQANALVFRYAGTGRKESLPRPLHRLTSVGQHGTCHAKTEPPSRSSETSYKPRNYHSFHSRICCCHRPGFSPTSTTPNLNQGRRPGHRCQRLMPMPAASMPMKDAPALKTTPHSEKPMGHRLTPS